jgi:hypothetical protein
MALVIERPAKRVMVMGGVVFVAVLLALAGRPAASQADGEIALSVTGPSEVTMPEGAMFEISVSSHPDGDVAVAVWDEYWEMVYKDNPGNPNCLNGCDYLAWAGRVGGQARQATFHFKAFGPNQTRSEVVTKTVTFNPPDWQVSLDVPEAVSSPDPFLVTMGVTPRLASQFSAYLMDADIDQYADMGCNTGWAPCSRSISTGWVGSPVTEHYQARLTMDGATFNSATKAITIYPPNFGVKVEAPPFVVPGQTYKVKVTHTYTQWAPYTIVLRDAGGTLIGYCSVNQTTCEFTRTAGAEGASESFTASVTYANDVVSQTSPTTVAFTDPATAATNDGINISDVAGLFGTTAAVCDSLLFFPGTHVQNTSTSDQQNACMLASQASGATVEDVIRAALAAMAAAGIAVNGQSLLAWLQHYIWEHGGTTWPPGDPPPPARPTNPPTSTPVPVASAIDALADSLTARNAAIATLGAAAATEIARRCLNLTGIEGLSGNDCKTLPIFMPGANHAEATNHRISAIASYAPWVRLTRRIGPRDLWYRSQPECTGNGGGLDCDEFPENRTYQGGSRGAQIHRPSIAVINAGDNQGLGGSLGQFMTNCGLADGQAFLVVPLPPALGIPTQSSICNNS